MDIRTIEAFIILSDCLNFTKAADKIYLSQSAFSRQIVRMEEEFGCELFVRNKRKVELTDYGRASLEHASNIYTEYNQWKLHLHQMQKSGSTRLNIGFLRDFPSEFFIHVIQRFVEKYPDTELFFSDLGINDMIEKVMHKHLDCGFSLYYKIGKIDNLEFLEVSSVRMCAVLPETHPLADKESLKIEELAQSKFVMISSHDYAQGFVHINSLCRLGGFVPNIAAYTTFVPSMFPLIKCGVGIGILAQSAESISPGGIRFVPIDNDFARLRICLFWSKDSESRILPSFIKIARSLL